MKVTVEALSTKEVKTKYGMKPTYSFKGNDGEWYSMGFKKPTFNKGEEVEFEFESTKYGNQVSAVLSSHAGSTTVPPAASAAPSAGYARKPWAGGSSGSGGKGVFPIPATDGQRSIIRQNALTNARETVMQLFTGTGAREENMDIVIPLIIKVARKYEAYTAGDTDAVADKKMAEADKEASE